MKEQTFGMLIVATCVVIIAGEMARISGVTFRTSLADVMSLFFLVWMSNTISKFIVDFAGVRT